MPTPSVPPRPSGLTVIRGVTITLIVAAIFYVSSHLSTFWATGGRASTPIFPGSGAALAALLLYGRQYWPTIFLGRLLAFGVADADLGLGLMLAISAANALAAWGSSWLLQRWARLDPALSRLRDVVWLGVGGGFGAAVIGATAGVSAMWLFGQVADGEYAGTWMRWWMGSMGGVLVVTPFALAWGAGDPVPRTLRYWAQLWACVVVTSIVCAWVFLGPPTAVPRTWVVWPVLLWSSLAFGVRGATIALLPATLISVVGTIMGTGVLGLTPEPNARYLLLQQFLMAASFTCLVLAVVADERRGKQLLRDREQRLHLALAAARSFGFEHDVQTDVVTRTAECADILGLPAAEAECCPVGAFIAHVAEADRHQFADSLSGLTPHQPAARLSYRFHRPDGRIVDIDESYTATFDAAGHPVRVVGVATDVTEQRRAEQEREALLAREQTARQEAEQAMLLRDEFLATVSHELRTPLNAILGWTQILQSGPCSAESLRSGLATIARNARLQTQLIDDLLDLSRMGDGRMRLEPQAVDLANVVADAVQAVTPAAAARHVAMHLERPASAVLVSGDAARLQQVFWNLIVNAVKFTEAGGTVWIRVGAGSDDHQRVSVTDTGKGIAANFLPFVFDRFRQADGSTTRRHSGLGIGLSLVRQLVEMHGGTVRASSEGEGRGATFTVELATLRAAAVATPAQAPPHLVLQALARHTMTVLVVDDDEDARDIALHVLEGSGARVITAASAAEGLRLLLLERPDVIVADIGMPGTDGYAFIAQVRSLAPGEGAETPAVALTALVREEDRRRALDAGYQAHLTKPVSADALVAAVSRLHPPRS